MVNPFWLKVRSAAELPLFERKLSPQTVSLWAIWVLGDEGRRALGSQRALTTSRQGFDLEHAGFGQEHARRPACAVMSDFPEGCPCVTGAE